MADTFKLSGSYTTRPVVGTQSGAPSIDAPIDETVQLDSMVFQQYLLTSDSPLAIDFSSMGVDSANIVIVKTIGGKIRVRLTSTDGSTQAIPVDSFFLNISLTVPFTALDLTRTAGVETQVRVFLGERA